MISGFELRFCERKRRSVMTINCIKQLRQETARPILSQMFNSSALDSTTRKEVRLCNLNRNKKFLKGVRQLLQSYKHEYHGKRIDLHRFDEYNRSEDWKNLWPLSVACCFVGREFLGHDNSLQNANIKKADQFLYRQHGHFRPVVSNICFSIEFNTFAYVLG